MKIKKRKVPAYRRALSRIFEHISKKLHNKKTKLFCGVVIGITIFILGSISGVFFLSFYSTVNRERAPGVGDAIDRLGIPLMVKKIRFELQRANSLVKLIEIACYPLRYVKALSTQPEKIQINIKFDDYQRLAYARELALAEGAYFSSSDDYVSATLTHDGETFRIWIRMKGDLQDHWIDDKLWSFMVKMRDNSTLLGMRRVSLQHPRTVVYLDEWYHLRFLSYSGLIGLRANLVEVMLNGDTLGVYYMKEHYDKRLIEHNELREGPVYKVDDSLWLHKSVYDSPLLDFDETYFSSDFEAYSMGRLSRNPILWEQFEKGRDLIESFREGKLKTHEVFDVDKLATFMAVHALFGDPHPTIYHNLRLYYNPITSRLEPIGGEGAVRQLPKDNGEFGGFIGLRRKIGVPASEATECWPGLNLIFSDEVFFKEYIAALEEISEPAVLDDFLSSVAEEAEEAEHILHRSYPSYEFDKEPTIYENQQTIKEILNPQRGIRTHFVSADSEAGVLLMEVGNTIGLPIEVLDVTYNSTIVLEPTSRILLQPKDYLEAVDFKDVTFTIPSGLEWDSILLSDMVIHYRILGASTIREGVIFGWTHLDEDFLDDDLIRKQPNAESFEFITIHDTAQTISIQPGYWALSDNLIIPSGHTVLCSEGTTLDLQTNATILSYSRFLCSGSEEYPVRFISSDSTGQGLTILNADDISRFEHVIFENLSAPSQGGWTLTGAVTFYESPVELEYCSFRNGLAEDGLNIVHSDFTMKNCLFKESFSDCFDGDFVEGVIEDTSFMGCENDGLDVSGSVVTATNIITRCGDKGVSIGEESTATLTGLIIDGGLIGIASKDTSTVTLEDVSITGSGYGFGAYQKKSEFGPASITASGVTMKGVGAEFIVEKGSTISIDGEIFTSSETNVNGKLYPEE